MVRPIRPEEYEFPAVTNFADPLREIYKRQLEQKDRFHTASRDADKTMVAASEIELNLVKKLANFAPTVKDALDKHNERVKTKEGQEYAMQVAKVGASDLEAQSTLEIFRDNEIAEGDKIKALAAKAGVDEHRARDLYALTGARSIHVQEHFFRTLSAGHSQHYTDKNRGPSPGVSWEEHYNSAESEAQQREILRQFEQERIFKHDFNAEAYTKYAKPSWDKFENNVLGITTTKKNSAASKLNELQGSTELRSAFQSQEPVVAARLLAEQRNSILAGLPEDFPNRVEYSNNIIRKRIEGLVGVVPNNELVNILDSKTVPWKSLHRGMEGKANEDGNLAISDSLFQSGSTERRNLLKTNNRIWGERAEKLRKNEYKGIENEAINYANNPENQLRPDYKTKLGEYQGKLKNLDIESKTIAEYLKADITQDAINATEVRALNYINAGKYQDALNEIKGIPQLEAKYNEEWDAKRDAFKTQEGDKRMTAIETLVGKNAGIWDPNKLEYNVTNSEALDLTTQLKGEFAREVNINIENGDSLAVSNAYSTVLDRFNRKGGGATISLNKDKLAALNATDESSNYAWFTQGKDPRTGEQRDAGFWILEEQSAVVSDAINKNLPNTKLNNNSVQGKTKQNKQIENLGLGEFYTQRDLEYTFLTKGHTLITPKDLQEIFTRGYLTENVLNLSNTFNLPLTSILEAAKISAENDEETELPTGFEENFKALDAMIDAEQLLIDQLPKDLLRACRLGNVSPKQLQRCAAILDKDIENLPTRLFFDLKDEDEDEVSGFEHMA